MCKPFSGQDSTQPYTIPPDFNLQEFVDEIADENLQGQSISPEIAAAYRRNLALVMETNWHDYTQKSQPEITPPNSTLSTENQHTTSTSDTNESRKEPETRGLLPGSLHSHLKDAHAKEIS